MVFSALTLAALMVTLPVPLPVMPLPVNDKVPLETLTVAVRLVPL